MTVKMRSFNIYVYEACVNGISVSYLRLFLRPGKRLSCGFALDTQVDGFSNQMPAVRHTAYIGIVLGTPQSAGNKTHTFQLGSGSVSKLYHTALHLRRVTITVTAAFAGEFLLGEVLDAIPPIISLRRGLFQNLPTGYGTGNAIGGQTVFSLPLNGGILRFLPCKTIDRDFAISDLFLKGFDEVDGFAMVKVPNIPSASSA